MIFKVFILISFLTCIEFGTTISSSNYPYVKTLSGTLRGYYKKSEEGRLFEAYESIPYAVPPIGDLRFEPPVPIPQWPTMIHANKKPEPCKQFNAMNFSIFGHEDCLYLNVYIPVERKGLIPVIFWIHGGGFQFGTSVNYGPKYLMDRDLILVTINYRLGPLGFISTNDDVVPGNMGLKDQSLALRWIKQNIQYFGGDPERITLTGVSGGGSSVHYHYLSPMSRDLFNNGISFSGTAMDSFAHAENTKNTTVTFAKLLNCTVESSEMMVQCLKSVPSDIMYKSLQESLSLLPFSYAAFPPVSEKIKTGYFINKSPKQILEKGEVYDRPWITGLVEDDGLFMTAGFILNDKIVEYVDENWTYLAPYSLHYKYTVPENKYARIANLTKLYYIGNQRFNTNEITKKNLTRLIGDGLFAIGAERAAKLQAKVNKNPVWFYLYTYKAAQSFTNFLSKSTKKLGVSHDDDIYLVLENLYIDPLTTKTDKAMLKNMLDFWYSFASIGKPNLTVPWTPLNSSSGDFTYMHVAGPNNFKMETDNNFREIEFWNSIGL